MFPLKWIAQGMRSVFFPDQLASAEMAGSWETGRTALVLCAWAVGGLRACACSPSSGSSAAPREPAHATMSGVTATGASSTDELRGHVAAAAAAGGTARSP